MADPKSLVVVDDYIGNLDTMLDILKPVRPQSRKYHINAALLFIKAHTFSIGSEEALSFFHQFLDSFAGFSGYDAVRSLVFPNFWKFRVKPEEGEEYNAYIGLMLPCENLEQVRLGYETPFCSAAKKSIKKNGGKHIDGQAIAKLYGLRSILWCENLKRISFDLFLGPDERVRNKRLAMLASKNVGSQMDYLLGEYALSKRDIELQEIWRTVGSEAEDLPYWVTG